MSVTTYGTFDGALAAALALAAYPYILLSADLTALVLSTPIPAPSQQTFRFALPLDAHTQAIVYTLLTHKDMVKVVFAGPGIHTAMPPAPVLDLQMVAALAPQDGDVHAQSANSETPRTFGARFVATNKKRATGRRKLLALEECVASVLDLRGGTEELVRDIGGMSVFPPDPTSRAAAH
jgi:hypothetical protein